MCLYSTLRRNQKYVPNQKNGGQWLPVKDERTKVVPVACGRCIECRKAIARDWQIRMLEDIRENKNGIMVTLTFSDESIKELTEIIKEEQGEGITGYELDNEIATLAVRRFNERWRKKHRKALRHWLVTELGHQGTENIHLHGIVWTDKPRQDIIDKWNYGGGEYKGTWIGKWVNEATVNYTVKYIHKVDADHKEYKPKILTSAGIGSAYLRRADSLRNKYKGEDTREYYVSRNGHKSALPKYYRNKIYTDEEKEELWIKKLNEEKRYVLGQKIDISKGEEEYYKLLGEAQVKNKRLGYQTNVIDWNRKKYEEQRRTMLQQKRMERAELKADWIENPPEALRGLGTPPESGESINDALRRAGSREWEF